MRDSKLRDAQGACIIEEVIDGTKDCPWGMIFIMDLSICTNLPGNIKQEVTYLLEIFYLLI